MILYHTADGSRTSTKESGTISTFLDEKLRLIAHFHPGGPFSGKPCVEVSLEDLNVDNEEDAEKLLEDAHLMHLAQEKAERMPSPRKLRLK